MRLLWLLVLFAAASASYVNKLTYRTSPHVRETVRAFKAGGLMIPPQRIQGLPYSYSVKIQRDLISFLTEHLENILERIVLHIQHVVETGDQVAGALLMMAEYTVWELFQIGGQAWKDTEKWLHDIADKVGGALESYIDGWLEVDKTLRKLSVGEVVGSLISWITSHESIEALIQYIQSIPAEMAEMAAEFLQYLNLSEIAQLITNILSGNNSTRDLGDIWNNITDFFGDLISNLPGHWEGFTNWISSIWNSALAAAESKLEQLQIIAQELIENAHNLGGTVVQQALEFLKPFADQLGDLWEQAVEAAASAVSGSRKH